MIPKTTLFLTCQLEVTLINQKDLAKERLTIENSKWQKVSNG